MPQSDTYIEKESDINDEIDRLRHAATRSLLTRRDTVIVASVSCIYGLGSPDEYRNVVLNIRTGQEIGLRKTVRRLVDMYYDRKRYGHGEGPVQGERATRSKSCRLTRNSPSECSSSAMRWNESRSSIP